MTVLYGIKNCDTVKKAFKFLDGKLDYKFHDFKKEGLSRETLEHLIKKSSLEQLINKRGTTWRRLPEEVKSSNDPELLIAAILENPSLIKRPVIESEKICNLLIGYDENAYNKLAS